MRSSSNSLRKGDADGNDKYFKVQNSWGVTYGDKGFIRLEIEDGGYGTCGMYTVMQFVDGVYNWSTNPSSLPKTQAPLRLIYFEKSLHTISVLHYPSKFAQL